MDLSNQSASSNVEDHRGGGRRKAALGGGIGAMLVVLIAGYFGINPQVAQQFLALVGGGAGQQNVEPGQGKADGYKEFSEKILGSTEEVWTTLFRENGYGEYKKPGMKLFSEQVDSEGCGMAPSSVGPFYCPASTKAEFSQAYVIGHEVGHHVQNLLRYEREVDAARIGLNGYQKEGENAGIRLELQADYLAGVWANRAKDKLKIDENDIRSAITTAKAIGDDRIQTKMRGWASPESFNHGKAEQRLKYFMEGFKTGDASEVALRRFFNKKTKPLDL